jgi:hypothetical protein
MRRPRKPDWLQFADTNAMFPIWMMVGFSPILLVPFFDK